MEDPKPKLEVLKPKQWTSPEDVQEAIQWILDMQAKDGIKSIVVCGELADGRVYYHSSRTENVFEIGGLMIKTAIRLMQDTNASE